MTRAILGLFVVSFLSGCLDRKPTGTPPAKSTVGPVENAAPPPKRGGMTAADLPQTSRATYLGGTVESYGPALFDVDKSTSLAAATNLGALGDESLRWFYKGLTSCTPHVVDYSVSYMPGVDARPYLELFEPLLLPMLDSENRTRRSQSAVKLAQMKSAKGAKRMRELIDHPATAKRDKDHFHALLLKNDL